MIHDPSKDLLCSRAFHESGRLEALTGRGGSGDRPDPTRPDPRGLSSSVKSPAILVHVVHILYGVYVLTC